MKLNLYIFSQKLTAKILKTIHSVVYLQGKCMNKNNIFYKSIELNL